MNWAIFSGKEPVLYAGRSGRLAGPKAAEFRAWMWIEGLVALSPTGPVVRVPTRDQVELFSAAMVYLREVAKVEVDKVVTPAGYDELFPPNPTEVF